MQKNPNELEFTFVHLMEAFMLGYKRAVLKGRCIEMDTIRPADIAGAQAEFFREMESSEPPIEGYERRNRSFFDHFDI